MTDKDGKIVLVNKSFSRMLGWSEEEVVGKKMTDVIEREDETGNKIALQHRILSGVLSGKSFSTSSVNHSYFVRKDKTRFPVKIVATPVLIDRNVMGAVETFFDVTEEKTLDKMRSDFLMMASHQLRTPLAGTRWLLETLLGSILGGKLNKRQREYVEDLYRINSRMILLVTELLNALHIQSGRISIKIESLRAPKIFDEALIMLRPVAKYADITLELTDMLPTAEVQTDLGLAKTILESLVSNAITYSRPGHKVMLGAREMGDLVVFWVKDSGIGIPPEEQKMIFEKFYRASNAQLSQPDGSGLGLYTAAMLAEKIGAKITFDSVHGEGSTFYLKVPKVSSIVQSPTT
jgi:PAS domain S-box-containing protein